jgi:acyl-coenzyme A synthetase/AMP-(fatty) acid ligase
MGLPFLFRFPRLCQRILRYCDLRRYDLSRLRHGLTAAGEVLSPALAEQWHQATGNWGSLQRSRAVVVRTSNIYMSFVPESGRVCWL